MAVWGRDCYLVAPTSSARHLDATILLCRRPPVLAAAAVVAAVVAIQSSGPPLLALSATHIYSQVMSWAVTCYKNAAALTRMRHFVSLCPRCGAGTMCAIVYTHFSLMAMDLSTTSAEICQIWKYIYTFSNYKSILVITNNCKYCIHLHTLHTIANNDNYAPCVQLCTTVYTIQTTHNISAASQKHLCIKYSLTITIYIYIWQNENFFFPKRFPDIDPGSE